MQLISIPNADPSPEMKSRVVFTQGGKGGTGKTGLVTGLVNWCDRYSYPYTLIDLDTEASKSRGSLAHYFPGKAIKVDIHKNEGLDYLLNALEDGPPLVIADMGAGAGHVAHTWFDAIYEGARDLGVAFTAIGLVTPDPASVDSVLKWADALQDRADYLIVKNAMSSRPDFGLWEETPRAQQFREIFRPQIIEMKYRDSSFETAARNYGVTIADAAARKTTVPELRKFAAVIHAKTYRDQIFAEFDRVREVLLP
jgi:hypothetical protein